MKLMDDKTLDGWKASLAKDGVFYDTDEEYHETINNFVAFIDILIEIDQKQKSSPSHTDKKGGDVLYLTDQDGNKIIL
jgi:hypothetical protein